MSWGRGEVMGAGGRGGACGGEGEGRGGSQLKAVVENQAK